MPAAPLPRGVYEAPFRDLMGRRVLYAIASDGRRICEASLLSSQREYELTATLRRLLDEEDRQRSAA